MQQHSSATERAGGKCKSIGKRKLSDQVQGKPQQKTIAELFRNTASEQEYLSSSSNKRPRPSSPYPAQTLDRLMSPEKMYNFSNPEPKSNGAFRPQTSSVSLRPSNFTPHSGAKKLVVKNLRSGPRLNQDTYFEKIWGQLDAALIAIFSDGKPDASLEELYKGGENVCRQGRAAVLAHKLQEKCKEYVTQVLRPSLVARAGDGDSISTLRAVVDTWTTWSSKLV
jgi:Cullin family